MHEVLDDVGKIPVKFWLNPYCIEPSAMFQIFNLANLPFAFHHVAIMSDCHSGYGMPIGGVLATKDVIVPFAVGKDISCGVAALKTNLTEIDTDVLKKIMGRIRELVPVGNGPGGSHKETSSALIKATPNIGNISPKVFDFSVIWKEFDNAVKQLGTLGGGNHFIEIQKGSDGFIWIMIHSGSRHLGNEVCDYYNKIAIKLNEKYFSSVSKEWKLAFLPIDSEQGQAYIEEMNYCIEYAFANRKQIMQRCCEAFDLWTPDFYNIAHNYAALENHFGQNIWVHRKGATRVRKDEIGIIPGSQGTKSYIVKGKGNPDSFMSCSHGAGRKMSRTAARNNLNLESEKALLDSKGIIHAIRNQSDLDEAPSAYKDINVVMKNQEDLVEILVELTPLAVIKG